MSEELKELSILIVTWNGDDLLKNCLDSLIRACGDAPEIVVVDNANLASTKTLVATYPNAKYIAAPENLGFAGGNNLGLPLCTRPYVLLLNNDTIVHEEPFTQLIQYLKDHPKVAVVQGKMRLVRFGDILDECGSYLTSWGEVCSRGWKMPTSIHIASGPVFHAKGACLMFRKSIIEALDGILFHDHFKSNFEDVDFCHRVWLTGNEVHFVNTPPIDHLLGCTVKKFIDQSVDVHGETNRWFSLATTLEMSSLRKMEFRCKLLWAMLALRFIIALDIGKAKRYISIFKSCCSQKELVNNIRPTVQKTRRVSDAAIFRQIMIVPPPLFHLRRLHGEDTTPLLDVTLLPIGKMANDND